MFRGPHFIISSMQAGTTPIFKRLWYDCTQQQPGIEPTNPLGQCWLPPIVAFYDQQGLLRTYSLPGSSIGSPHPGSPSKEYKFEFWHLSVHLLRNTSTENFLWNSVTSVGEQTSQVRVLALKNGGSFIILSHLVRSVSPLMIMIMYCILFVSLWD